MNTIYEPKGKAREYSPLALNIYDGCDHQCDYCYVRNFKSDYYNTSGEREIMPRKNIIQELLKDASKYSNKSQVLLCFTGDPYCHADVKYQTTRKVLKILLDNNVLVSILTKGGSRAKRDIDIIKKFKNKIKFGSTLTFFDEKLSLKYEPFAALPSDRFETLKFFHNNNVRTWVSLEPVILEEETFRIIDETYKYVDEYKVGLTNYYTLPKQIDWKNFAEKVVKKLRMLNKDFYVKEDLRKYLDDGFLSKKESDMDYLTIKQEKEIKLF